MVFPLSHRVTAHISDLIHGYTNTVNTTVYTVIYCIYYGAEYFTGTLKYDAHVEVMQACVPHIVGDYVLH